MKFATGLACAAAALLVASMPADAHRGSSTAARAYLKGAIKKYKRGSAKASKVQVDRCRATAKTARHSHKVACRVRLALVYKDKSKKGCSDKSVSVVASGSRWRFVKSTFLRGRNFSCGTRVGVKLPKKVKPPKATTPKTPPGSTTAPGTGDRPSTTTKPAPTAPTTPPQTGRPLPPPSNLPPFPRVAKKKIPSAAKISNSTAKASQAPSYTYIQYYPLFKWNGYWWHWKEWSYLGPAGCRADYVEAYWWNGYTWVWSGYAYYKARSIYLGNTAAWDTQPPC